MNAVGFSSIYFETRATGQRTESEFGYLGLGQASASTPIKNDFRIYRP